MTCEFFFLQVSVLLKGEAPINRDLKQDIR